MDNLLNFCPECKKRKVQKHLNSKYCLPCALKLRKKPKSNLTPDQEKLALELRGDFSKEEIASFIGASRSSLGRFGRDKGLSFAHFRGSRKYQIVPNLIPTVIDYYVEHGKVETIRRFPNVNVRSIVERYSHAPRQVRWKGEQIKELARLAGIISMKAQAKYFNRPRANEGSIRSAWMKKFGFGGGCVNGLSWNTAKHFVTKDCQPIETFYWRTRRKDKNGNVAFGRKMVLWTELEKYLKPNSPKWLKDAVRAMSRFQVWLHETKRPKSKILKYIREIENAK